MKSQHLQGWHPVNTQRAGPRPTLIRCQNQVLRFPLDSYLQAARGAYPIARFWLDCLVDWFDPIQWQIGGCPIGLSLEKVAFPACNAEFPSHKKDHWPT